MGGMGVVYAATHVELRLPVALKIIHPDLSTSKEARARFCIEARAGAALRSPHTLRVFDAGQLGSEDCFVVTERLEGTNLDELLRTTGPLSVDVAVDYVLQACTGLGEAHGIGLIHRDIKPENLFLAHYRCSAPVIKVMDFGVARWLGNELRSGRITSPRSSLGSPCYQSPEQMENATDVDERSDIWAMGLVLFELLTGECPFESDTIQETCWKVLKGPRPSLKKSLPAVDPGLSDVVDRCLALDRKQRFGSVKQLAAALRPYTSRTMDLRPGGLALAARRASSIKPGRMRAPVSRGRAMLVSVAAFALGIGATIALQRTEPHWVGMRQTVWDTSNAAYVRAGSAFHKLLAEAPRLGATRSAP
jgi:serine/threonine protein kinase